MQITRVKPGAFASWVFKITFGPSDFAFEIAGGLAGLILGCEVVREAGLGFRGNFSGHTLACKDRGFDWGGAGDTWESPHDYLLGQRWGCVFQGHCWPMVQVQMPVGVSYWI